MADYYPLLKRAVAGLADATPAARQAIYERARKALLGQLRSIDPPVAPEDIDRESAELDAAIAKLEADMFPAAPEPVPVPAPPDPIPPPPVAPISILDEPAVPADRSSSPAEKLPTPAMAAPDGTGEATPSIAAPSEAAAEPAPTPETRLRPREPHRPMAPTPPPPRGQYRRPLILGAAVAMVVALVAAAALKLRTSPEDLARLKPVAAPTAETTASGKIAERVGEPAPAASVPIVLPPPAPQQAASTEPATPQPSPAPVPTVTQAPIPVASRAALLVEAPDLDAKVRTFIGSTVWRFDNVPAGTGQPLGAAVHAEVDLPDAKVKVTLDIRKNTDPALPASNTMEVRFTLGAGSVLPGINQISVPQMRREDSPNGDVLAGVPVKITDTYFLVGLAQGDIAGRNADLMRNRGWLDIPIQLSDNHIAKLTLEKGTSGDRILADALTTWAQ